MLEVLACARSKYRGPDTAGVKILPLFFGVIDSSPQLFSYLGIIQKVGSIYIV